VNFPTLKSRLLQNVVLAVKVKAKAKAQEVLAKMAKSQAENAANRNKILKTNISR
jgi:hypothetical protein